MTNWDKWCLGLTVREKRKAFCWMYDDCDLCPLAAIDDCNNDYQVSEWLDKTVEIQSESEDKE